MAAETVSTGAAWRSVERISASLLRTEIFERCGPVQHERLGRPVGKPLTTPHRAGLCSDPATSAELWYRRSIGYRDISKYCPGKRADSKLLSPRCENRG